MTVESPARIAFAQEHRELRITAAIGSVLFPAYYLHDVILEPDLLGTLIWVRVLGGAIWLFVALQLRRQLRPEVARAWFSAALATTGPMVAYIIPRVDHYSVYLIGYSAYYWGHAGLSWPLRWTIGAMLWNGATLGLALALGPVPLSTINPLGTLLYIVVAGAFSASACRSRRQAYLAAFLANRALAVRNDELEVALTRLGETQARLVAQEKLSALGRMLAGLSHELNNPVNVIKNNLDPVREHVHELVESLLQVRASGAAETLARQWHERELDWRIPDVTDALDSMDMATRHMIQVHQVLRSFIRGDAPGFEETDVAAGVRTTAQLLARRLPPGVTLELELDELPRLRCQPAQLNQVWLNLLQNALDAVGERGRVTVRGRRLPDGLELSVTDSGPGVEAGIRPRLFEPFTTSKPPGKGTGLGLAICYEIITQHGGKLWLDDTYRDGARFVVMLPRSPQTTATLPTPGREPPPLRAAS